MSSTNRPIEAERIDGLPTVGDGSGLARDGSFFKEEVQIASRNRGMPLEALGDPLTPAGLHFLIVHFDIPAIDRTDWRLTIDGLVTTPLRLSLDEVRERPAVSLPVTLECAGNGRALLSPRPISQPWFLEGVSTATWTGTPLRGLLQEAGLDPRAVELVFSGLDWGVQGGEVQPYQRSLSIDEALRDEVLLAYAMDGRLLPPQHGAPLRLLAPGWYGMASVKWLGHIEAVAEPFSGYQMTGSYRYACDANDPGEPVTLMKPRALMAPPGIPDFASRLRIVQAGPVSLRGRAWSGREVIERVDVTADHGRSWMPADLEPPTSEYAWRGWNCTWEARPGRHTLSVRATDSAGRVQPSEPPWNYQGMGNNAVQSVGVLVL